MTWINLSTAFGYGTKLTSANMQQLRDNLPAMAYQEENAPIAMSSYKGMFGFDMDGISNVNSPLFADGIEIQTGRCLDAAGTQAIYLDGSYTKAINSGANYSFGNSGGSVPSSFSSIWPDGTQDNQTWFNIFLIKNTSTGSVDWGLDTDIDSANNLMVEVNSVNGGGWDSFRRLGSVMVYDEDRFMGFYKRGNIFHRNTFINRVCSATAVGSWFPLEKIGPTGTTCLINVIYGSARNAGDYVFISPYGVGSYGAEYGKFGATKAVDAPYQEATLFCNSGNCECKVSSATTTVYWNLNWWIDPFTQ